MPDRPSRPFPPAGRRWKTRLAEHAGRLEAADLGLTENKAARRVLEKDVAAVQGRLTKFKDQLMAVKTNKEYHAVQSEIAGANAEVQRLEDLILERMLEADESCGRPSRRRGRALAQEQAAILEEQSRLERERDRFQARVERHGEDRAALVADLTPHLLETFDTLIRGRKGIAVGAVREGRCGACQVRLRPQLVQRGTAEREVDSVRELPAHSLLPGGSGRPPCAVIHSRTDGTPA